jgi:hypothetical protein
VVKVICFIGNIACMLFTKLYTITFWLL